MSRTDDKYLKQLRSRYRKARKKERTAILDEFVKTTGYHRKHATAVLNGRRARAQGPIKRPRAKVYGADVARELAPLADLFDNVCSKRLRAALDAELPRLYQAGAVPVSTEIYQKLMAVSPATIDRLLIRDQPVIGIRRGFTRPGTLLKD